MIPNTASEEKPPSTSKFSPNQWDPKASLRGKSFLIVDDFPGNAQRTAQQLSAQLDGECRVVSVQDPFEAVMVARHAIAQRAPFDALVLDPLMRGYNPENHQTELKHGDSVLRDIARASLAAKTPLPAVVFYSREQDREIIGDIAGAMQRLRWEVPPQIPQGLEALVPISISAHEDGEEELVAALGHCSRIAGPAQSEMLTRGILERVRLSGLRPPTALFFMHRVYETIEELADTATQIFNEMPELSGKAGRVQGQFNLARLRTLSYPAHTMVGETGLGRFLRHELRNELGNACFGLDRLLKEINPATLSDQTQKAIRRYSELKDLYKIYWDVRHTEPEVLKINDELRALAEKNGCAFTDTGEKLTLRAPRDLLMQVLQQPIGNATKFTQGIPNSKVEVHIESVSPVALPAPFAQQVREVFSRHVIPPKSLIHIVVSDNGPGIPPENIERVFEPGFTTSKENGGTGWGLGFVRESMADLRGVCRIESETEGADRGTRFHFFFPN
jgi:signal transduction histidine kinase